ncbi:MAG: hypothetical protein LBQ76_09515 [Candidatus Fibromonas sp.]|jgi:DNA repair exonuclease SbcCD ATPase subunit|nr:hypothetical protein [Candidatus Fibromonas sp.]
MAEKNGITRLERAQAAAWKAIREGQKATREFREESQKATRDFRKEMQEYREKSQKSWEEYREESQKDLQKYREESQKAAQEFREEMREFRKSMREINESMRNSIQKVSDNIDKLSEENREFRKSLELVNYRSGTFANKLGKFWELMIVPHIDEKFNELGFHFKSVNPNFDFDKPNANDKTLAEVDILLENEDSAVVVEVKDNFKEKYLAEHIVRMKKLKALPRFANKKLYGAIAAAFVKDEFKRQAFKHGFYVLNRPDTVNVEIEPFPKGCKPRAW